MYCIHIYTYIHIHLYTYIYYYNSADQFINDINLNISKYYLLVINK